MATLWNRPDSKYFWACFTGADGKPCRKSTKVPKKNLGGVGGRMRAQSVADAFERAAQGKRSAQHARKVISDISEVLTGSALETTTVRQFCADWLASKEAVKAESTADSYSGAVKRFLAYLGPAADRDIEDLSAEQIEGFRDSELQRVAVSTANHTLKIIRMVFRRAKKRKLVSEDPTEEVETMREGEKFKLPAFTIEQVRAVLAACDDEWRSMVYFGLYTGQRIGDVGRLTWRNIDLQAGVVRLVTRKNSRTLLIPICDPLRAHIESLPAGDDPAAPLHPKVFEVMERTGRVAAVSNAFIEILASVGLREPQSHQKKAAGRNSRRKREGLSFHSLRRTTASLLDAAGVPQSVRMEIMGHDDEREHQGYLRVGAEGMRKAAAALPSLDAPDAAGE